ncbi:MarR family winged helix-turn-helix transcriptional regulator [Nocardiopsis suaedae]|uniref:MarR family transcriptional regulator n=1 Tax=Nocardiopsis suaedae TaxID=3018444 RepID=A0ABT4TGR0_9ACTN|nr:MarR family transcriptional regulator [Nocardiopsis suaedae]MDA2803893.1 MarR family transcriptional regulator [Nocardiopsis suaedae]
MPDDQPRDPLSLDAQLCFTVYAASRALTGLYRDLLADLGLTYPQYLVMLVLWERGPVPVKELGAALRLDSGTLSPLLRRLEAAGLVGRERSGSDERVVRAVLTERGAAMRERAERIPERVLCATGLDGQEARTLRALLDRVTSSLGADAPPPGAASACQPPPQEDRA